jgi:hypothetical protein
MDGCDNCDSHGFPCMLCAVVVYDGLRGPGFSSSGSRNLITCNCGLNTDDTIENMKRWMAAHPIQAKSVVATHCGCNFNQTGKDVKW